MPKRPGRKSAAQTPAPKSDRIYGSSKNAAKSASSEASASSISLSSKITKALENKLEKFKETHNTKKVSLRDLKAVYRRGLGAYSNSHRPTITGGVPNSRNAWAMARVNKFLLKAGGTKVKAAYVQDDDLMKYEGGGLVKGRLYAIRGKFNNKYRFIEEVTYMGINKGFISFSNVSYDGKVTEIIMGSPKEIKIYKRVQGEWTEIVNPKFDEENEEYEYGGKIPNDLRELPYFQGAYKGAEFYSMENNEKYEKMAYRWYDLMQKHQGGEKLNEKEFEEFKKLSSDLYKSDEYKEGGKVWNDKELLKKYNSGESIGFTGIAHLKAQGLIKRADGTKRKSMEEGGEIEKNMIQLPDVQSTEESLKRVLGMQGYKLEKKAQNIKCIGCGWEWNTIDSEDFDKYICHKCGFDNRTFYDSDPIGYKKGGETESEKELKEIYKIQKMQELQKTMADGGSVTRPKFSDYLTEVKYDAKSMSKRNKTYVFHDIWNKGVSENYSWGTDEDLEYMKEKGLDFKVIATYDKGEEIMADGGTTYQVKNYMVTAIYKNADYDEVVDHLKVKATSPYAAEYEAIKEIMQENEGHILEAEIDIVGVVEEGTNLAEGEIMAKGGKTKAKGDCYVAAGDIVLNYLLSQRGFGAYRSEFEFQGTPYLVHAEVAGQGHLEGVRYGHAWIEDDNFVYDYSNGRKIVFPKQLYYSIGDVDEDNPMKYQKYTFEEAKDRMMKTGNYGCWDIDVEFADGGFVIDEEEVVDEEVVEIPISENLQISDEVVCVNCDCEWNKANSDKEHMYNCHKCGFDNTLFYTVFKDTMTLEQIAEKHGVDMEYLEAQFEEGTKYEMEEHTKGGTNLSREVGETIALHHLEEAPEYYEKIKLIQAYKNGGDISSKEQYLDLLLTEAFDLLDSHVNNGGLLDYSQDEYEYLNDEVEEVQVGYFKEVDSSYAEELREEGFEMDLQEAIDTLEHRLSSIDEGMKELFGKEYSTRWDDFKKNNKYEDGGEIKFFKKGKWKYILINKKRGNNFQKWSNKKETLEKEIEFLKNQNPELASEMEIYETKIDENSGNYGIHKVPFYEATSTFILTKDKMAKGGKTEDCGCGSSITKMGNYVLAKGGLAYGNSHDKGGMPMKVQSTGQNIEIEGGEGVINKRSMQMTKKVNFEGKMMTPCEVISKINEMGGGVKFDCSDVKEIIEKDGDF